MNSGGEIGQALQDLPAPALLLDVSGRVHWQNSRARSVWGDALGRPFAMLAAPHAQRDLERTLEEVARVGGTYETTLAFVDAGGAEHAAQLSPVLCQAKRVVGMIVLALTCRPVHACVSPARPPQLSSRQFAVLTLLDEGHSTQEIAEGLGLSPVTVRNHIAKLLNVMGAHSRIEALAVARRLGYLRG